MSVNNLQSSASRPSIDQMLPTRHSQLELSSQKSSNFMYGNPFGTNINRGSNIFRTFPQNRISSGSVLGEDGLTPVTIGSQSNLARKQRQLEQEMAIQR